MLEVADEKQKRRSGALVILLGLVVGTLGLVTAALYTVGVLILFVGGVGVAVLAASTSSGTQQPAIARLMASPVSR